MNIFELHPSNNSNQGSKCWVPRFPQALNIFHGNSTLHLEFPAGNPAKTAGKLRLGNQSLSNELQISLNIPKYFSSEIPVTFLEQGLQA